MKSFSVGIAGYMGSGKSTCARYIASKIDSTLVDVDREAKRLLQDSADIQKQIQEAFGADSCRNHKPRFDILGKRAFKSLHELEKLNAIVHPPLLDRLRGMLDSYSGGGIIVDAALISFWQIESWFDIVVWVDADREERMERVANSVALSRPEIAARMDIQERLVPYPRSNRWYNVYNNGKIKDLFMQCDTMTGQWRRRSG